MSQPGYQIPKSRKLPLRKNGSVFYSISYAKHKESLERYAFKNGVNAYRVKLPI